MKRLKEYKELYQNELTQNVMPFWLKLVDRQHGGLHDHAARDGSLLSTDKGGWVQGRFLWVLSKILNSFLPSALHNREQYVEAARLTESFLSEKLIRDDRRVYFEVTQDGSPLVLRRYLFSEMFAAMGLAEYASFTGKDDYLKKAWEILETVDRLSGKLEPKIYPETRALRSHSATMMLINVFQVMRENAGDKTEYCNRRIDRQIRQIKKFFVNKEKKVLLELVNEDGSPAEGPEGRLVNPGHAIETAWFLMLEGRLRKIREYELLGIQLLEWHLDFGWDARYSGLFNFLDCDQKCPQPVEWNMKYWWPHCEALIASIKAYEITKDQKFLDWFVKIHDYTREVFPDRTHGEWFGYFTRENTLSLDLKGNHFKGPFHVPRMLLFVSQTLEQLQETIL